LGKKTCTCCARILLKIKDLWRCKKKYMEVEEKIVKKFKNNILTQPNTIKNHGCQNIHSPHI